MNRNFKFIFATFIFCLSHAHASVPVAKEFMDQMLRFSELAEKESGTGSAASTALLKTLEARLDYTSFTKKALGVSAKKFSASQRLQFQELLESLVELSAFPKAKLISAKKETLQYEKVGTRDVMIKGMLQREKDGDLVVNDFLLRLYFSAGNRIVDVKIEEQLLSTNIARQISKNLEKKSVEELLKLMAQRIEKLKEGASSKP